MKKKPVECKDVMNHICENLHEGLNSERCREIKKHLDNCSSCQEYFKSVELTIECYQKYNIDLPKEAHDRLMNFLGLGDKSG
jgi:predicted anti-sigma-YlaC factor YlaD